MKTLLTNRPWVPLMLLLIVAAVMSKRAQANPLDTPDKRCGPTMCFGTVMLLRTAP